MRTNLKKLMPLLLAVVLIVAVGVVLFGKTSSKDDVVICDENNSVYTPNEENLVIDKQELKQYYNNMLVVYTFENLSDEQMNELAESVDGKVAASAECINEFQIKFKECTLQELNEKIEQLENDDRVAFARTDAPMNISIEAADDNPWSDKPKKPEADRGNENNPDGNDWWAEAIGAYTAWEYDDEVTPITIGVVDSGFDVNHEDLKDKITILNDTVNTADSHGTHVAGLIGATNNSVGIRGVADNCTLLCKDIAPDEKSEEWESSVYMLAMNSMMIDAGAKVINNSWGLDVPSRNEYQTSEDYAENRESGMTHTEYIGSVMNCATESARDSVFMMIMKLAEKKDFIIVQSAGNGYDNEGPGYPSILCGCFCSITQKTFDECKFMAEKYGISLTYDDIEKRILVVGAVENQKSGDTYKMTTFSNYSAGVDICAPGEKIFSTVPDNSYANLSGTSMAAPIVTGSAGYLWSLNPDLTGPQVHDLLKEQSTKAVGVGDDEGTDYPMLNIGKAVKYTRIPNVFDYLFSKSGCEKLAQIMSAKKLTDQNYVSCSKSDWSYISRYDEADISRMISYGEQNVSFDGVKYNDDYSQAYNTLMSNGWKEDEFDLFTTVYDAEDYMLFEDTLWGTYILEDEDSDYTKVTGEKLSESEAMALIDKCYKDTEDNVQHSFVKKYGDCYVSMWMLVSDSKVKVIEVSKHSRDDLATCEKAICASDGTWRAEMMKFVYQQFEEYIIDSDYEQYLDMPVFSAADIDDDGILEISNYLNTYPHEEYFYNNGEIQSITTFAGFQYDKKNKLLWENFKNDNFYTKDTIYEFENSSIKRKILEEEFEGGYLYDEYPDFEKAYEQYQKLEKEYKKNTVDKYISYPDVKELSVDFENMLTYREIIDYICNYGIE